MIKRVHQVDDEDRKTAEQYGADHDMTKAAVEAKYAAAGDIVCPSGFLQAQVTLERDLITTAAHMIYEEAKCKQISDWRACKFHLKVNGKNQKYGLKAVLKSGIKCPIKDKDGAFANDWLILRLDHDVDKSVKPYDIPLYGHGTITQGQKVVFVGKSFDWPNGLKGELHDRPRHFADCDLKRYMPPGIKGLHETNCDISSGSSEGSLFTSTENPILVGVTSAQTMPRRTSKSPECLYASRKNDRGPYQWNCWASLYVPVENEFKKSLMEITGLTDDGRQQGPNPKPLVRNRVQLI